MESEYYEVTSEIDAREILRYLNDLGIHNISGEVLKYFITDLKKFIKYDLQKKYNQSNGQTQKHEMLGPERLHSASTFSSRIRSRAQEDGILKCSRDCPGAKRILNVRNVHSAPSLGRRQVEDDKPLRRACSCIRVERKPESSVPSKPTVSNGNLIKVPKQPVKKKCDPVSLYHYYTSLWAKYRPNVPGENNWAELRWEMRQKMAGCVDKPKVKKVADNLKVKGKDEVKKP